MWVITLIILALAAFFIIKAVKGHSAKQSAEQERLAQGSGLEGRLSNGIDSSRDAHDQSNLASAAGAAAAVTTATQSSTAATQSSAASENQSAASVAATDLSSPGTHTGKVADPVQTGDVTSYVREMIKILNLAEADAPRLSLTADQFRALRQATTDDLPAEDTIAEVADRLRRMLA